MINRPLSQHSFTAVCMVSGQLLLTLASFFWNDSGRYTVNGSTIVILSMVFWAAGFVGIFDLLRPRFPFYSQVGLLYALYGCLGGAAFGFEGLYSAIFDVSEKIGLEAHKVFPLQMNLVLYWAGPAFPLTLMVLGIVMAWKKVVSPVAGYLLIAGGLAFPVSRITRIEWITHLADLLLLLPVIIIAINMMKYRKAESDSETAKKHLT